MHPSPTLSGALPYPQHFEEELVAARVANEQLDGALVEGHPELECHGEDKLLELVRNPFESAYTANVQRNRSTALPNERGLHYHRSIAVFTSLCRTADFHTVPFPTDSHTQVGSPW